MADLWPGRDGPAIAYISPPPPSGWCEEWPRSLVILGSTGSIGASAISVVQANPGAFTVLGLACARNVRRLLAQALTFRPPFLAVLDDDAARRLQEELPRDYRPTVLAGPAGYARLASLPEASTVLSAQVGAAGLAGTLAAALAGKVICLANKESLVLAGAMVRDIASRTGASLLPVDSEHNAIFQCLAGRGQDAAHLVLTASGGPFLGKRRNELASVTAAQALNHPNWRMGAKISIDSATMMNKGLELVEAHHLFGVDSPRIRVLVHPQSVVHSLVEMADGSAIAQMGTADMRLPLGHCLLWPRSLPSGAPALDLSRSPLTFHEPDTDTFPCLALARQALRQRGGLCVVMNAANEAAVELFLAGRCSFLDIPRLIAHAMEAHGPNGNGVPFCPPLRTGGGPVNFDELANEVHMITQRIEALDMRSRQLVRNAAGQEERTC
jgi:1-deoxy-D-xylulose-5-phosphate reductoisomerase